ncbi:hypothetical protein GLUCOINTEAF2_0204044 [Komagataeibacter intermedius AF2]|uniref:Uncharacterized protein n=1 Tax=Komagataeibacter intermedius AF2 TaxID=1458464 RepID=A0A0C1VER9_9PROT|nr:hypothetical protein GLUCOINTEAF2_0204044 [Komagataeibacter intermedius AF2]
MRTIKASVGQTGREFTKQGEGFPAPLEVVHRKGNEKHLFDRGCGVDAGPVAAQLARECLERAGFTVAVLCIDSEARAPFGTCQSRVRGQGDTIRGRYKPVQSASDEAFQCRKHFCLDRDQTFQIERFCKSAGGSTPHA